MSRASPVGATWTPPFTSCFSASLPHPTMSAPRAAAVSLPRRAFHMRHPFRGGMLPPICNREGWIRPGNVRAAAPLTPSSTTGPDLEEPRLPRLARRVPFESARDLVERLAPRMGEDERLLIEVTSPGRPQDDELSFVSRLTGFE